MGCRQRVFPILLPVIESSKELQTIMEICDGFLFTGGQDVETTLYHTEKTPLCGECSPERDKMEKLILDEASKRDKLILGICRGIQFINAALGGTLWQDIPSHNIEIKTDLPPYTLLKRKSISVHSYHHQLSSSRCA